MRPRWPARRATNETTEGPALLLDLVRALARQAAREDHERAAAAVAGHRGVRTMQQDAGELPTSAP
jgi:hypothetical protein